MPSDFAPNLRPIPFRPGIVRLVVPPRVVGVYLLFRRTRPVYVGRSDTDLRRRLLTHPHRRADQFVFVICDDIESAYRFERRVFEEQSPPWNVRCPARPATKHYGSRAVG